MRKTLEGIRRAHGRPKRQARALPRGNGPVCPVSALENWLKHAGIHEGSVFRAVNRWDRLQPHALSGASVNRLLKALGETCGLDFVPTLSSHSFRRGLSTAAAREKVDFAQIKRQGGWKHDGTVRGYIEEGQQFTDNAASTLLTKVARLIEGTD